MAGFRKSIVFRFLILGLCLWVLLFVGISVDKYKAEHEVLQAKLDTLSATYSLVLAKPLAQNNIYELELHAIALLADPEIYTLEINNGQTSVFSHTSDIVSRSEYEKISEITYFDNSELKTVGSLMIGLSDHIINAHIRSTLINSILLFLMLLLPTFLGMYLAYKRIIAKPIDLLVRAMSENIKTSHYMPIHYELNDEFGTIIDAYNKMQTREEALRAQVLQSQTALEKEIKETKSLQSQLAYEASHDALTNLYNRRMFERHLVRLIQAYQDSGTPCVLAMMDLDNFKVINDTCGHLAGDAALLEISTLMTKNIPKNAILARLGGDEFSILFENLSLEQAKVQLEQLIDQIKNHRFKWKQQSFTLGISVGLAPFGQELIDSEALSVAVDKACYKAKKQGGNHIYICQDMSGMDELELYIKQF